MVREALLIPTLAPEQSYIPKRARHADAAFDLKANVTEIIAPGATRLIDTAIALAIPSGHVGLVCSRSGLALKHSVIVLNAPGVIDPGYRGSIGVILHNLGAEPYMVVRGDRIAQLLILPTAAASLAWASATQWEMSSGTERGENGLGSTGAA